LDRLLQNSNSAGLPALIIAVFGIALLVAAASFMLRWLPHTPPVDLGRWLVWLGAACALFATGSTIFVQAEQFRSGLEAVAAQTASSQELVGQMVPGVFPAGTNQMMTPTHHFGAATCVGAGSAPCNGLDLAMGFL